MLFPAFDWMGPKSQTCFQSLAPSTSYVFIQNHKKSREWSCCGSLAPDRCGKACQGITAGRSQGQDSLTPEAGVGRSCPARANGPRKESGVLMRSPAPALPTHMA